MATMDKADIHRGFQVDPWVHFLGGLVTGHPGMWRTVSGWETRLLSDSLSGIVVDRPVYIAGLARSGSTKLLEVLNWHPDAITHRYRDFPLLYTPYLWNRFLDYTPRRDPAPMERSHRDGIQVTPDSPEAFEEMLWMAFFPGIHDPRESSVLDATTDEPAFETFYRDHIRKMLLVRGGRRYISKANYNITRLEYLLKVFPDARILIPVRDPLWHVASLMKQHRLFCHGQAGNPKAVTHLRRVGHFEFGMDRRPINAGDHATVARIQELWEHGEEVEAWARYWNHIHTFVADRLERSPVLRDASLVVRYEDLCRQPFATVQRCLEHCKLQSSHALLRDAEKSIHFPTYYRPRFSDEDIDCIRRITGDTADRFGLGRLDPAAGTGGSGSRAFYRGADISKSNSNTQH